MQDLAYKPYPSCRFNHTAIDAALEVRSKPGFDVSRVTAIRAYQTVAGREAIGTPLHMRQHPQTLTQAQFSICYNIACALVNGAVGLADFADTAALHRPDIAALTALVEPLVDDDIERVWGRSVSPTLLEVETEDGTVFTARVDEAKGSLSAPLTDHDRHRKLVDCLQFGGFDTDAAARIEDTLHNLIHSVDVGADMRELSHALAQP